MLALSSVEVDISGIEQGQLQVVKWRGKPVFIKHRNAEEIAVRHCSNAYSDYLRMCSSDIVHKKCRFRRDFSTGQKTALTPTMILFPNFEIDCRR